MSAHHLTFRAGPGAFESVRRHGFAPERIGTIAGASGGAKWLVLSQLDRAILRNVVPLLQGPVHLVGTSIGAWRFACYAQEDPLAAIERFEHAYIHQEYSPDPDIHEITAKGRELLGVIFGDAEARQVLGHPLFRTHIMTVRARHIAASERRHLLGAALLLAASLNLASRRSLGWFFERALFFDARDLPPFFDVRGFPLQRIMLRDNNLHDAIAATGAIPLVLAGVKDIAGARHGVYRDGGIVDYHLDLPHADADRLALFPHFYDHIVPGWFDKKLGWRRPDPAHVDRTILVSPSAEFVAGLPNRKIPDRTDFEAFAPQRRMHLWRQVVAECERLADEFCEVIEKGQLEARLKPL